MYSFDDFEISFSSEHEIFGLCDNENNEEYAYFMQFGFIAERRNKNAYIVNKQRPRAHRSQAERAGRFEKETGFLLRIKANISTDERFSRETRR